jgi:dienelactone hydrolase
MKRLILSFCLLLISSLSYSAVVGKEVDYKAGDVTLKGYLAVDDSIEGKRPGVLVVHEWWGHNEYARKRADMLAELGYTALAVDMYGEG